MSATLACCGWLIVGLTGDIIRRKHLSEKTSFIAKRATWKRDLVGVFSKRRFLQRNVPR